MSKRSAENTTKQNCFLALHFPKLSSTRSTLIKLQLTTNTYQEGKPYCLGNAYSLSFEAVEKPILAKLNVEAVYHSIYCDEKVFDAIGIEGCVAIDIALAKGGTEAIAESFYSVMKSQQCTGGQSNKILVLT